jgi:hypothetical protein
MNQRVVEIKDDDRLVHTTACSNASLSCALGK